MNGHWWQWYTVVVVHQWNGGTQWGRRGCLESNLIDLKQPGGGAPPLLILLSTLKYDFHNACSYVTISKLFTWVLSSVTSTARWWARPGGAPPLLILLSTLEYECHNVTSSLILLQTFHLCLFNTSIAWVLPSGSSDSKVTKVHHLIFSLKS